MLDEILMPRMLKVAAQTVHTIARRGLQTAFKVRGQWRFKGVDLDTWIEEQKEAMRGEGQT
ncbi:helix-turn-helix domain-containing protein [Mesorhizobium sp. L103C131B0]|uniref:helix-turn-helix domain-containing protein n=1 Tax=Mesorhizobium sp. L103C131B0 TaxID=1287089 RepID=UPI0003D06AD0|nr:helix-turn-helix domain-containing protein [Mesorhizobium sp. L103C131B0]ESZ65720.1 DNA-binding protein [Mesorhizobium sp. L103C131B0]